MPALCLPRSVHRRPTNRRLRCSRRRCSSMCKLSTVEDDLVQVRTVFAHGLGQGTSRRVADLVSERMDEQCGKRDSAEVRGLRGELQVCGVIEIPSARAAEPVASEGVVRKQGRLHGRWPTPAGTNRPGPVCLLAALVAYSFSGRGRVKHIEQRLDVCFEVAHHLREVFFVKEHVVPLPSEILGLGIDGICQRTERVSARQFRARDAAR